MYELLHDTELFKGLGAGELRRLSTVGRVRALGGGEYLFLLGDTAHYISIVVKGQVDLCFPISIGGVVRDISVETVGAGMTVGWSALVKPYRFTLSARAAEPTQVLAFARHDLQKMADSEPEIGRLLFARISELMAGRLSMFQALWARELQRTLENGRRPEA